MVKSFSSSIALLFFCFLHLLILSSGSGFTVDLIHRDSPLSPFYDASKTDSDRITSAFHHSHSRAAYFREAKSTKKFQAQVQPLPYGLAYIIVASIGTPPSPFYGLIDTGIDITWTQCKPCDGLCYNQTVPFFDPTQSSTYTTVNCSSPTCRGSFNFSCQSPVEPTSDICHYKVSYIDGSFSDGDVAIETFTFGSTSVPNLIFGCGRDHQGRFPNASSGLLGLGGGGFSFTSQMKGSTDGKFSYCLVPYDAKSNATGKLSFGDDSVVSGPGTVSTPFIGGGIPTFYEVRLESVRIGNSTFPYPGYKNSSVIVDSGTALTFLPSELVSSIESELKQVVKGTPIPDPKGVLRLCYYTSTTQLDGPPVTFRFTGAELDIPQKRVFFEAKGVACLGIIPGRVPIFGNLLQVNLLVGFDTVGNKLSFKPTDCSQQQAAGQKL